MELAPLKRKIDAAYVARGGVLRDDSAVSAFLAAVDVEPDEHTIARFLHSLWRSNSIAASPRGELGRSQSVSSRTSGHAARQERELVSVDDCVEIAKQCLEVQRRKSVGGNDTHYLHLAWAGCGGDEGRRGVIERQALEQQLRQFGVGLPPDVIATSEPSGGAGYDDDQPATMDFEDVVALVSVSKALLQVVSHTNDARKLKLPASMTAHMSAEERRTAQLHAMILFRFKKRLAQVMTARRRRKKEEAEREAALMRHASIRHSTFRAGGLAGRGGGGGGLRAVPTHRVRRGSSCGMDSDRSPHSARGLQTSARGASMSLGSGSGPLGVAAAQPPLVTALSSSTAGGGASASPELALQVVSAAPHGGPLAMGAAALNSGAAGVGEYGVGGGGESGSPAVLHKTSQAWHLSRPFKSTKLEVDWIAQPAPIPVPIVQRTATTSPERPHHSVSAEIREHKAGTVLPRLREHLVHLLEDQRRCLEMEAHGAHELAGHSLSQSRARLGGPRVSIAVAVDPDSMDSSSFAKAAVPCRTVACQVSEDEIAAALGIVQRKRPLVARRSLLPPLPHAGGVFGPHAKKKSSGNGQRRR